MKRSRTIRTPLRTSSSSPQSSRVGFTLIEMLMAVTLVLIMMVMFAEVFQLAGGSVTKQRTLADNDQNARTFVTILRGDLDKRTYRSLIPFSPGEPRELTSLFSTPRRGYFYLSNNSLGDTTDDVLQFTVDSRIIEKNKDESLYYGAAVQLPVPAPAAWGGNPALAVYSFLQNPNQPDFDDAQIISNGAAASSAAEVCYFMRGTRLYRRVMLIREPSKQASVDATIPGQPMISEDFNLNGNLDVGEDVDGDGVLDRRLDYFAYPFPTYPLGYNPASPANTSPHKTFWAQFDYSAFQRPTVLPMPAGARFVGINFLQNEDPLAAFPLLSSYHYSLGQTWNRFGFNSQFTASNNFNGLPREFSGTTAPFFMGRYTQEETSNAAFQYPQVMPATGNPMDAAATTLTDANDDGVIDAYAGGSRTGVDLLLSNVHQFSIEVWDERIGDFVSMGHGLGGATNPGDYSSSPMRRLNATYGPQIAPAAAGLAAILPNVFDTWHPHFDRNYNGILGDTADLPPFRPLTSNPLLPTTVTGSPKGPTPPGNPFPSLRGYWAPNTSYALNDVVFPLREDLNGNGILDAGEDGSNGFALDGQLQENVRIGDEDANGNGMFDMGEDTNGNGTFDRGELPGVLTEDLDGDNILDPGEDGTWGFPIDGAINKLNLRQPAFPTGLTLAYRCVRAETSGPYRNSEPRNGAWSTSVGEIIHGTPAEPDWKVEYNARPLKAIRITVRFEHPTSQQMRQVTIVHSLRDHLAVP